MTAPTKPTPREFGQALRHTREAATLSLDAISVRTKIGVRLLTAIEEGEFGLLPSHTFARMFLRQYLEMLRVPEQEWLAAFEAAWRQFADSSQPLPVGLPIRPRKRRFGPWAVGVAVVAGTGAAVFLVESRREPGRPINVVRAPAQETANALEPSRSGPAPEPSSVVPAAPAVSPRPAATGAVTSPGAVASPSQAPATTLVVSALRGACWVEVTVAGEKAASRLLAAGAAWQVPAAGRAVDLVLGDAGAASVSYLGDLHDPAGRPGQVVRLHLAGNTAPPAAP